MQRTVLLIALLFVFAVSVSAQELMPTETAAEELCFNHNGTLDEESGQCQQHMNVDLKMDYPLALVDYPFIMNEVDSYYEQLRLNFLDMAESTGFAPSPVFNWELYVSYDIAAQTDSLVSVIFYDYEFTGGAHGNTALHTMNFDLSTGRELTLAISSRRVPSPTRPSPAMRRPRSKTASEPVPPSPRVTALMQPTFSIGPSRPMASPFTSHPIRSRRTPQASRKSPSRWQNSVSVISAM